MAAGAFIVFIRNRMCALTEPLIARVSTSIPVKKTSMSTVKEVIFPELRVSFSGIVPRSPFPGSTAAQAPGGDAQGIRVKERNWVRVEKGLFCLWLTPRSADIADVPCS